MKMKKTLLALISILSLISSVHAELRVWTDDNGKKIEAEHVRTTNDKVILRQADGTEIKVSLDTLSERDRRYATLQAPPRIEISVSTDVDRFNKTGGSNRGPGVQLQEETITAEVKIRKCSPAPYEAPLMSEVYLIGQLEQADHYVILERTKSRFSFTEKNESVFKSKDVSLKQMESGRQVGLEYRGYLVIVRDKAGTILEMKTNKLDFQKNAETIIGSERGVAFDEEFNPLPSRKPTKENELRRRNPFPGRRL